MANNKFKEGPGGRLVRAQADATRVNFDPRPKGPYIVQYDKIDILNPNDWKYGIVKGLKKANTMLGGDIERGGYDKESYSDVMNRLEQTPGTLQNVIKEAELPTIPSPIAAPVNVGIKAYNAARPYINRGAAAVGEVALDPANFFGGRIIKGVGQGLKLASQIPNISARAAQVLQGTGVAAPWINRAKDVGEIVGQYIGYPTKPKFNQDVIRREEEKSLSPSQKEFLQKISRYNFGNVK
jgi:hypothetical protein